MQQMHQGQMPGPPSTINLPQAQQASPSSTQTLIAPAQAPSQGPPGPVFVKASSLDDLVSGAADDADKAANTAEAKPEQPKPKAAPEEKKPKKEKDKGMKLIYSDNEVSPEEKMARLPRYAFVPSG